MEREDIERLQNELEDLARNEQGIEVRYYRENEKVYRHISNGFGYVERMDITPYVNSEILKEIEKFK